MAWNWILWKQSEIKDYVLALPCLLASMIKHGFKILKTLNVDATKVATTEKLKLLQSYTDLWSEFGYH